MAKLVSFVGVSGVGKTTLAQVLAAAGGFATGFEQHDSRPFQRLFERDKHYALHNQVDYFLLRAEQERALRADPRPALIDGGLDVDFYAFTRLFHTRGYLSGAEFDLCRRLYTQLRLALPAPELVVHLTATDDVIQNRLAHRERINIASVEDTALLKEYLAAWLVTLPDNRVMVLDVSDSSANYHEILPQLQAAIRSYVCCSS
jgi:deoxyguanosine kinase